MSANNTYDRNKSASSTNSKPPLSGRTSISPGINNELSNNNNNAGNQPSVGAQIVDDEPKKEKKPYMESCKKASKFIFSHVGLVLMVIVYAIVGAFLFELLEKNQETKDCQEGKGEEAINIVNLKSKLLTYIQFNITTNPLDTSKDNETVANANIEDWLTGFRDQVFDIKSTYRYHGQSCDSYKWNFAGALLFAVTIITTIGNFYSLVF
jgi:hypothetical protein